MYKSNTGTVTVHDILGSFDFMMLIDLFEVVLLTHEQQETHKSDQVSDFFLSYL